MEKFHDRPYDIEATVKNCRHESKTFFRSGYRPAFDIHQFYATSGEITFLDRQDLHYDEEATALVKFITPEYYPKSIWAGKKISFKEGARITGYAIVTKIINKNLESDIPGEEMPLVSEIMEIIDKLNKQNKN